MWCHLVLMSPVIGLGLFLILPWATALPLYLVILALSLFLYAKIMQSMTPNSPICHQAIWRGCYRAIQRYQYLLF